MRANRCALLGIDDGAVGITAMLVKARTRYALWERCERFRDEFHAADCRRPLNKKCRRIFNRFQRSCSRKCDRLRKRLFAGRVAVKSFVRAKCSLLGMNFGTLSSVPRKDRVRAPPSRRPTPLTSPHCGRWKRQLERRCKGKRKSKNRRCRSLTKLVASRCNVVCSVLAERHTKCDLSDDPDKCQRVLKKLLNKYQCNKKKTKRKKKVSTCVSARKTLRRCRGKRARKSKACKKARRMKVRCDLICPVLFDRRRSCSTSKNVKKCRRGLTHVIQKLRCPVAKKKESCKRMRRRAKRSCRGRRRRRSKQCRKLRRFVCVCMVCNFKFWF